MSVQQPVVSKYQKNSLGQYICSHCTYTARIQSTMHYHMKKHEGALPHACNHCTQKFLQKSLLDLHISARHQETLTTPQTKFKCPCTTCQYEDIRKGNRMIHFLRVHMKELTDALKEPSKESDCAVQCKECHKPFKSATQFYYHASACVQPSKDHPLYKEWKEVSTVTL
jgi:hypothetical protein